MSSGSTMVPSRALVLLVVSGLVLSLTAAGQRARAQDTPDDITDVMLLLDGSGSIDAADWTLQLDGYAATIDDPEAIPRDGSFAVGVVQWSSTVRVEVPLTVIDSEASARSVTDAVAAIQQLGQLTNPGDGVRAGTDALVADGRDGSRRTLCMSTDGPTNAGESLASATAHAQASGVDRFSVVGIADSGFSEAALRNHYEPHTFADGSTSFTAARSTLEFTSLIGGCFADAVDLVALEVTQGVQDLANSVPLLAQRITVVRAYLQSRDDDPMPVTGRLHGTREGIPLPFSPLTANNPGQRVTAGQLVVDRRGVLHDTLNFRLPQSWAAGDVELRLEVPSGIICAHDSPVCDLPTTEVTFQDAGTFELAVIGVEFEDDAGNRQRPTRAHLIEQARRARQTLPIGDMDTTYGELVVDGWTESFFARPSNEVEWFLLLDTLRAYRQRQDGCWGILGCDRRYYAAIPGPTAGGPSGFALGIGPEGLDSGGFLMDKTDRLATGEVRNLVAHELGHTLGVDHATHSSNGGTVRDFGWCGEDAPFTAPDWPYTTTNDVGDTVAAIGPMDNPFLRIWGFDTRFAFARAGTDAAALALSNPADIFALMSYCDPDDPISQGRWISKFAYEKIAERDGVVGTSAATAASVDDGLSVSGLLDVGSGEVEFAPVLPAPAGGPLGEPTGDYTVEVLDAAGMVVASAGATVREGADADGEDVEPTLRSFDALVPRPDGAVAAIRLVHDGAELGRIVASPSAPSISGLSVTGSGDPDEDVRIAWQASDADGDTQRALVEYSANGGATWRILGMWIAGTSLTVPSHAVPASSTGLFRVTSADGVHTAAATVGPLPVADTAPFVALEAPEDGATFTGLQLVPLEAVAGDTEDGTLEGANVMWESDVDGVLATGASATLTAAELTEGTHTITVTATDSAGNTASDAVTIGIGRLAQPGPPDDAVSAIQALIVRVDAHGFDLGIRRSIVAKLESALRGLDGGNEQRACRSLTAFVNEVRALEGTHLTMDQADALATEAERIRTQLLTC